MNLSQYIDNKKKELECKCNNAVPVFEFHRNNSKHYFMQCVKCLRKYPIKKDVMLKNWSENCIKEAVESEFIPSVRQLISQKYNEYLFSELWKNKRIEVIKKYSEKCACCGIDEANQVHHLTYERLFNENIADLVLLCVDCHEQVHIVDKIIVDKSAKEYNDYYPYIKYVCQDEVRNLWL